MATVKTATIGQLGEHLLIEGAIAHDQAAIRSIIRQHNHRLFRVARSVLRDDFEAEDAVQDAYLQAFSKIGTFRKEASLATWLSRIVLNESLQRLRARKSRPRADVELHEHKEAQIIPFPVQLGGTIDPEKTMAQRELVALVEQAVDSLPDDFRIVLVARAIEGLTVEETSSLLEIRTETVKTRLFRARKLLREALAQHIDPLLLDVFPFFGTRCEKMADRVMERLKLK